MRAKDLSISVAYVAAVAETRGLVSWNRDDLGVENRISFITLRYHRLHASPLRLGVCAKYRICLKVAYNKASRGPGVGGATQFGDDSHQMVTDNLAPLPFRQTWEREARTFGRFHHAVHACRLRIASGLMALVNEWELLPPLLGPTIVLPHTLVFRPRY